ncbi:hypothetical protein NP493_1143g01050 [Ridgeia piscesae]|uniref:CUB domain-containing protein n=1 Tax=Ridgeia piscesae TaxID=27915 RepID=A0AAD9KHR6_RIDPI|nr:hypothetical protein NP493_1143g01050 [Ridgeia piscesae]
MGLLTAPEGQISRRRTNITFNMTCQWKIEVVENMRVGLHFSSIDIPGCSQCSCGQLNIYDGSNTSTPMIESICGNHHGDIASSGNTLFLYYEAVENQGYSGFMIQYYTTDGKTCI